MREDVLPPAGLRRERRGPLTWMVGPTAHPLDHIVCHSRLDGRTADEVVAGEVTRAHAERRGFVWSAYSHDEPRNLRQVLETHGLQPGSEQTVLTISSAAASLDVAPPSGVTLRRIRSIDEVDRVLDVQEAVWGPSATPWLRRWFTMELGTGSTLALFVAEAQGTPIGAAWTTLHPGRSLAGLYGGTVLPAWRGRGVYRSLVASRARAARDAGVPHLVCGANANSAPHLRRMGFSDVATCMEMTFPSPGA